MRTRHGGRHQKRSPAIEDEIEARLAAGETLAGICRDEHMPSVPAVLGWCERDPAWSERYARARRIGLDVMAEQAIAIADDASLDPAGRRVAVDARKWFLSKLRPDKYGDRSGLEISGPGGGAVQVEVSAAKQALAARLDQIAASGQQE